MKSLKTETISDRVYLYALAHTVGLIPSIMGTLLDTNELGYTPPAQNGLGARDRIELVQLELSRIGRLLDRLTPEDKKLYLNFVLNGDKKTRQIVQIEKILTR